MEETKGYELCTPRVVSETVDGEVIVVDLASGNYYSLRDTAAYIWHALVQGVSVQAVICKVRESLNQKDASVDRDVLDFAEALVKEGLIHPSSRVTKAEPGPCGSYQKPVFEKFSDMREFLLVDPIHEVNIRGWPHQDAPPANDSSESEKRT